MLRRFFQFLWELFFVNDLKTKQSEYEALREAMFKDD